MSYTSNVIYLTHIIYALSTCTCTHTYIHHLDTSFCVRYANYFVYKKQSSLPVPGLRRPAFLSWLSVGSHVIRPSHFMSLCLCLPSGEQGQHFSLSSELHPGDAKQEEQGCVTISRTMAILTFLMPWQYEYSK